MKSSQSFSSNRNTRVEPPSHQEPMLEKSSSLTIAMLTGAIGLIIGSLLPGGYGGTGFILGFILGFSLSSIGLIRSEVRRGKVQSFNSERAANIGQCPVCGTTLHVKLTTSRSVIKED